MLPYDNRLVGWGVGWEGKEGNDLFLQMAVCAAQMEALQSGAEVRLWVLLERKSPGRVAE